MFALYYKLEKIALFTEGNSYYVYKEEISLHEREASKIHQQRLEEIKKANENEKIASQWGMAREVFSWMLSLIGMVAGFALIATGIGAVGGAMLVTAGLITLTNQFLQLTGGWKKIAKILPGEDSEKKHAIISWMQIGITVLCLILTGGGALFGGKALFGEAMQSAMRVFGGIIAMGVGVTSIGKGVYDFMHRDKLKEAKWQELLLARIKHRRTDLMEKVNRQVEYLTQTFENLAKVLGFYNEMFRMEQRINKH